MDKFDALSAARSQFEQRLDLVKPDQWSLPTPCDAWDVRGLVNHVVTANTTSDRSLHGATRDEMIALIGADYLGDDPLGAFALAADAEAAAFRERGALDQIVHHPAFDMPAAQLLDFRIGDMLLHAWDLATAIGADETLDPRVVEVVWESLEPLAAALPASGAFGLGASGTVPADAPLQSRLLDVTGRRP